MTNNKPNIREVGQKEPEAKIPSEAELDEDEAMLRALRLDLPGPTDAPTGIVSVSVTDKFPKREFFRTHPTNLVPVLMVDHVSGMDVEYHIVDKPMKPVLESIKIDVASYVLYEILTADGALRLMPVRQADRDGSQNEWTKSKGTALVAAMKAWVRVSSDRPNQRYRVFPAAADRFPDPVWPDLKMSKLIRLAFTDRGRLINSPQHPLFEKWAAGNDNG